MNTYLIHHGVKGQKWGVRRYQNYDGTLTDIGKTRNRIKKVSKTKSQVEDIVKTFSEQEREKLGLTKDEKEYLTLEQGKYVAKRILLKNKNTPVSFFDMFDDDNEINVTLGTRSGKKYRGKGYASKAAAIGMDWYSKHASEYGNKPVVWGVKTNNKGSIKIAEKLGFERDETSLSEDKQWINYIKKY